ncbi:amidohydrolase [Luteimonas kalidii]|uniref:Amidohydrolase n=1 Tax=Luteimonas kalidii TaxID=3042025 RepID=A0ABT6JNW0_9GAMM|nr:amidohydrolase [Luteimonas kalidii]MDH5832375.1 amidohydrolase [Luteimonas kalidii]
MIRVRPALLVLALAPALACAQTTAPAADTGATDPRIDTAATAVRQKVVAWRRDLHRHPELGNRETRTAGVVADHLRALGLEPRIGIGPTGVVAVLKGARPGPRIALRADMDALPVTEATGLPFASTVKSEYRGQPVGVMHACGHDLHVAILMGVAEALAGMRDQLAGEVMFVFQPAEEGPPVAGEVAGARRMLDEGIWDDFKPDAVLGLHVWSRLHAGQIGVRAGPFMASADEWTLTVTGRQTHGSQPWAGVDPITVAAQVLLGAQSIVARQVDITAHPVVLTAGQIQSGTRFNIIPDTATMVGTLRTFDADVRQDVIDRFRNTAEHFAAASGATAELEVAGNAPATANDPALLQRLRPSLERAAGADNVVEVPRYTIAEDFSVFANTVPGLYFFVGTTPQGQELASAPMNHSPLYAPDESALDLGVRAMLQATVDFLDGGAIAE